MSRLKRIVDACGGVLMDNGRRALIRGPGHGPHDRSVSLFEADDGRVLIHCFSPNDDWRAVRTDLIARGLLSGGDYASAAAASDRAIHPREPPTNVEDKTARARRWWDEGRAVRGTLGEIYLRHRAIDGAPPDVDVMRFHPRVTSVDDKERRPALVAAIRGQDGALQGVQVTLINAQGRKANVATPRRIVGRMLGGAVRLGSPREDLVVAEGVETALSASEALFLPAWAALSADNLARFEPPTVVTRLCIAHDVDNAGYAAASALRQRLALRIAVELVPPPRSSGHWANDGTKDWPKDWPKDWNAWAQRERQTARGD